MKKRLFSGCTPTGNLTLGNYLGAMRYWKENQNTHDALFAIADLHALTVPRDPALIRERSRDFLCLYLACGVDPEKSTLFVQSHNPRHSELAWILDCLAGVGELNRMTQYKTKAARTGTAGGGLLTYPVLMAADILLYGAELVPAGDDQKQHLELTRRLGARLNTRYGLDLPLPEPLDFPGKN